MPGTSRPARQPRTNGVSLLASERSSRDQGKLRKSTADFTSGFLFCLFVFFRTKQLSCEAAAAAVGAGAAGRVAGDSGDSGDSERGWRGSGAGGAGSAASCEEVTPLKGKGEILPVSLRHPRTWKPCTFRESPCQKNCKTCLPPAPPSTRFSF